MRAAAQKVMETSVSRISPSLSEKMNWFKEESKWDLNGDFSGEHVFGIQIDNDKIADIILEGIKKNWKSDPFPARLLDAWSE